MKKNPLKIVFWGEDSFSNVILLSLIEAKHSIRFVITPFYDNLIYKKLEFTCNKYQIPFFRAKKINSDEVYNLIKNINPDICIIAHFERLIKEPLLSLPKLGFINLHPSLLPYYRGMAPQHWPIINGEKEAGLTIHYVDSETDTGNIILQKKFPLTDKMYVSDLQKIWLRYYRTIMIEALDLILKGNNTISQKNVSGSYYGKLRPEQCVINPNGSLNDAYNLIKGVSLPYYGAVYDDKTIFCAHIADNNEIIDSKALILRFKDGCLVVDKYKINNENNGKKNY